MSILTSAIEPPNPLKTALFPTPRFDQPNSERGQSPIPLEAQVIGNSSDSNNEFTHWIFRTAIGTILDGRFFSLNVPNEKPRKKGYRAIVFDTGWESNTRCKPKQPITTHESVYKNIYGYIHYTIERRECIDRCQYMLWHK